MKPVFYLSYSDIPEKTGLIFPNELEIGNYSPGIWVIAISNNHDIPNEFEFDAVNVNELFTFRLVRVNNLVYQVNTEKYGRFYFRINRLFFRYEKYVGTSKLIREEDKLFQLTPMDIQKLEQACENGFFFVGRSDNNLERRN